MNPNKQFLAEFAKSQQCSVQQAARLCADRAEAVAKLARVGFSGIESDKRGVLFTHYAGAEDAQGRGAVRPASCWFSLEAVIDEPSCVVAWARSQQETAKHIARLSGLTLSADYS